MHHKTGLMPKRNKMDLSEIKEALKDSPDLMSKLGTFETEFNNQVTMKETAVKNEIKLKDYRNTVNSIAGIESGTSLEDSITGVNTFVSGLNGKIDALSSTASSNDLTQAQNAEDTKKLMQEVLQFKTELEKSKSENTLNASKEVFRKELSAMGIKSTDAQDLAISSNLALIKSGEGLDSGAKLFSEKYPTLRDSEHKAGGGSLPSSNEQTIKGIKDLSITDKEGRIKAISDKYNIN